MVYHRAGVYARIVVLLALILSACGSAEAGESRGSTDADRPTTGASRSTAGARPTAEPVAIDTPKLDVTGEVPDDWKVIVSSSGLCQGAVPPDWLPAGQGGATSPGLDVVILVSGEQRSNWEEYKTATRRLRMSGHTLVEETSSRLLLKAGPQADLGYLLVERVSDRTVCSMQVTLQGEHVAANHPVAMQVMESLGVYIPEEGANPF